MIRIEFPHWRTLSGDITVVIAIGEMPLKDLYGSELDALAHMITEERDRRATEGSGLTVDETVLVKEGRKIELIKAIRYRTGLGLGDAKAIADRHLPPSRRTP